MGGSSWSDTSFRARETHRAATGESAFAHSEKMKSADPRDRKIHSKVDPKGLKFRESCDSDTHPQSRAVAVFFDETGSMGSIPLVLQKKLGQLNGFLLNKGHLDHPQILFGAIGDAHPLGDEVAPLQMGQFESGIEMDDVLGQLFLEGQGGHGKCESYDLAFYALARHTTLDCFKKRGEKGFAFVICDEMPYPSIEKKIVKQIFGEDIQSNIPIEEIIAEVQKTFHLFVLKLPYGGGDKETETRWRELLGQHVINITDPNLVCEVIATTIAVVEGTNLDDATRDLVAVGADTSDAEAVNKALVPFSKKVGTVTKSSGDISSLSPSSSKGRTGGRRP